MVAAAFDAGFDVGGIRGSDGRLRHQKGGADFAREQRLQPFVLLIGTAVTLQHFHIAGVGRRAVERLGSEADAAHHLAERRIIEIGQAGAILALVEEQIPQTLLPRLDLQLLDHGHDDPRIALLARLVHLAGIDLLGRINMRIHEVADALHPFLLARRIVEIHGFLRRCLIAMEVTLAFGPPRH